jgi:hypothetical protein
MPVAILSQERIKLLKKQYGGNEVGKVTVDMVLGGMRGIPVSARHLGISSQHVITLQSRLAGLRLVHLCGRA